MSRNAGTPLARLGARNPRQAVHHFRPRCPGCTSTRTPPTGCRGSASGDLMRTTSWTTDVHAAAVRRPARRERPGNHRWGNQGAGHPRRRCGPASWWRLAGAVDRQHPGHRRARLRRDRAADAGGASHQAAAGRQATHRSVDGSGFCRARDALAVRTRFERFGHTDDPSRRLSHPYADWLATTAALPSHLSLGRSCAFGAAPSSVAPGARLTAASCFHTLVSPDTPDPVAPSAAGAGVHCTPLGAPGGRV